MPADIGARLLDDLQSRYPLMVAAFSSMRGGERALQAVAELQQRWIGLSTGHAVTQPFRTVRDEEMLPDCPPHRDFDVVIAGGGLGLVFGAALAQQGLKVMVFDRSRVGAAHREWNISRRELGAFLRAGIFTEGDLADAIATTYGRGVIDFCPDGTGVPACPLELHGVLDVALDAQSVLDIARKRFVAAGGTILEQRTFSRLHMARSGRVSSVFELEGPEGTEYYRARLSIDMMGSVSPVAVALNGGLPFDGVCPTVGTIVQGLEVSASTGDVLVSTAGTQDGRQLIWEGFPGRHGETTVYVFYYDRAGGELAPKQSLLDLFERYFELLPTYRASGPDFQHLKPVFGYIPARYGRPGRAAARGLLCLGDSAAGQSPLTFCGFGSFARHAGRTSRLVKYALDHDLLEERHLRSISPHQPNLRVAWLFSRFMQPWPGSDDVAVNRIMNVFCRALSLVGPHTTVRFLQDRYSFAEYIRLMLVTSRIYPRVFALVARVLGPRGLARWLADMAAFAADDLLRAIASGPAGRRVWRAAERSARRLAPGMALVMLSRRTRWEATR